MPKKLHIDIDITESDIETVFKEIVYNNKTETWEYIDSSGKFSISVRFMNEEEYMNRGEV